MNQYICTFRGKRDKYQIPLALAESELLDQYIKNIVKRYHYQFIKNREG
jgi:hypothetical protein